MRKTFAAFPELLFIDATYKLNDLRMPVYIICLWKMVMAKVK